MHASIDRVFMQERDAQFKVQKMGKTSVSHVVLFTMGRCSDGLCG